MPMLSPPRTPPPTHHTRSLQLARKQQRACSYSYHHSTKKECLEELKASIADLEAGFSLIMSFPLDYYNLELAGKPRGIKRVLKERGLWPERPQRRGQRG